MLFSSIPLRIKYFAPLLSIPPSLQPFRASPSRTLQLRPRTHHITVTSSSLIPNSLFIQSHLFSSQPHPAMSTFRQLQVQKLSTNFREATQVVEVPLPTELEPGQVLVKTTYAGVNATDVNVSAGRYNPGVPPPLSCGLEAVGVVEKVGSSVTKFKPGDPIVAFGYLAGYGEYFVANTADESESIVCLKAPNTSSEMLALGVSALTAAVSLGELGEVKKGECALVVAAAGGTGQFAVQLLKHVYGCTVIGTCSSAEKVEFLKSIGCDHVINYKTEDLDAKLSEYAPKGLDVVYEGVGGDTFNTAVKHIAKHGRVVTIGSMSSYCSDTPSFFVAPDGRSNLNTFLPFRSASVRGFSLFDFFPKIEHYFGQLLALVNNKTIRSSVDSTEFKGIDHVVDAVEHLHSGKSHGKVVVSFV